MSPERFTPMLCSTSRGLSKVPVWPPLILRMLGANDSQSENLRKCLFGSHRRDTDSRFMDKFGENRRLESYRKVSWFWRQKNSGSRECCPSPHFASDRLIAPAISQTLLPLNLCKSAEFLPDQLRYAGVIRKRSIFRIPKWSQWKPTKTYGYWLIPNSKRTSKNMLCMYPTRYHSHSTLQTVL